METEVLHRTLAPSFLISLRSYILPITLRFVFAELYEWSLDYSVPRFVLYHNQVTFWEKILKNLFRAKLHSRPKKVQKLSSPLISLG